MAFVVMPSGNKGEYANSKLSSEEIFDQIISPAIIASDLKLQPDLEIMNLRSANIPASIIEKLNYSKLVVADLTKANPNVTFELGVRWRSRCNGTVLISQEPSDNPFDVAHYRSLKYDSNDIETSIRSIAESIKQTLASGHHDSGVFDALPELPRVPFSMEEFWAPFLLDSVRIIIGSIPVKVEGQNRYVADYVAESIYSASEIVKQLHLLNQFKVDVLTQHIDKGRILDAIKENIIFIGTRNSHPIGGQELIKPNFRYDFEYTKFKRKYLLYKDNIESKYTLNQNEVFGIIHKIQSPFDKRKHLMLLGGNNRYATLAAARAVCGESHELIDKVRDRKCEVLYKSRLIEHKPLPITIEDILYID